MGIKIENLKLTTNKLSYDIGLKCKKDLEKDEYIFAQGDFVYDDKNNSYDSGIIGGLTFSNFPGYTMFAYEELTGKKA